MSSRRERNACLLAYAARGAAAARQAGLGDREIQATLTSARRITQHRQTHPRHSPEAEPK